MCALFISVPIVRFLYELYWSMVCDCFDVSSAFFVEFDEFVEFMV